MSSYPRRLKHGLPGFWRKFWGNWMRPVILPGLCILAAKSALADINVVPTGSMRPTIVEGDFVWVNKLAYDLRVPFTKTRLARWNTPAAGDVVVCFSPDDGTRLVKRVIGTPGDTVEMRNETLLINGRPLTYESFATNEPNVLSFRESLVDRPHAVSFIPSRPARRDFGPWLVPAESYLVLGDNRDNSRDSRFFGFVSRSEIIGRVRHVVVSFDIHNALRPRTDRFLARLD